LPGLREMPCENGCMGGVNGKGAYCKQSPEAYYVCQPPADYCEDNYLWRFEYNVIADTAGALCIYERKTSTPCTEPCTNGTCVTN
jgi:hypothetical protein